MSWGFRNFSRQQKEMAFGKANVEGVGKDIFNAVFKMSYLTSRLPFKLLATEIMWSATTSWMHKAIQYSATICVEI